MAGQEGMAKTSTRTSWKGAISSGLVHIPIAPYSATAETDLDMGPDWSADAFRDSFSEETMKLVERKARAGEPETVSRVEEAPSARGGAEVIDLSGLPRRSLQLGKAAARAAGKKSVAATSTTRRAA